MCINLCIKQVQKKIKRERREEGRKRGKLSDDLMLLSIVYSWLGMKNIKLKNMRGEEEFQVGKNIIHPLVFKNLILTLTQKLK